MKRFSLALAVLCGFLGNSARADHERPSGHEWHRVQNGPAFPGDAYWIQDDPVRGSGVRGRFGRGRRIEHQPYPMDFAPGWGGYDSVPPPPAPAWPIPGVALPNEGPSAVGHYHPGDFAQSPVPLYPRVRVKDGDKAPRHAVTVVLAVANPGRHGPSCVFVPVRVPTRPLRDMQVDDDGEKIELDYGDCKVEIESKRGIVTVEYDD
jgi:hypothetical protein